LTEIKQTLQCFAVEATVQQRTGSGVLGSVSADLEALLKGRETMPGDLGAGDRAPGWTPETKGYSGEGTGPDGGGWPSLHLFTARAGGPAMNLHSLSRGRRARRAATVAVGLLAGAALFNLRLARAAEARNPPRGRFVEAGGVALHYVESGTGPVLVLLHGNGSMTGDFASSGLIARAARRHRVIAFDRPGFGYSTRPRGRPMGAAAQARLIWAALDRIGVGRAVVLGHSWGASVAVAMALGAPERVAGLVLVSGYYYPTPRLDAALLGAPGVPVAGDVLSWTVGPGIARAIWPGLMRAIFAPAREPAKFRLFPKELALRPSQLRAAGVESGLLVPTAARMAGRYGALRMPVAVVAGEGDRIVDTRRQSVRLHRRLRRSRLTVVPGAGHMVHQTHTGAVLAAVEEVAGQGG
jgi:pimeloyl-ACP methyl ester carboxylesterase